MRRKSTGNEVPLLGYCRSRIMVRLIRLCPHSPASSLLHTAQGRNPRTTHAHRSTAPRCCPDVRTTGR